MRLGVLFSGGKDSFYAMHKAMMEHEVVCLITIVSKNKESYMFHTPNISITSLQAEAVGLPLICEETAGVKEEELADLKRAIKRAVDEYSIGGLVTGAIASVYQSKRIKNICSELGIECVNPLWGMDQVKLLEEVLENGFKVIISSVSAYSLDEKWLGRPIDEGLIKDLVKLRDKYAINPSGEGGEIETTVLDGPLFSKRIEVLESEVLHKGYSGVYVIKKAGLADR
ncbi:MAG: diphthine--ammonia ligase [Candidatus Altiarchaeota archaeon]